MKIIKTIDGSSFWTEKYIEKEGWLVFDTKTKKGKTQKHEINKSQIIEITETELNDEE